jgi:hypothetical protein
MVATKQKSLVEAQNNNRKDSKHTTTENHQIRKEGTKKGRNKILTRQPEKQLIKWN